MKTIILLLSWGIVASCGTPPSHTKTLADEQGAPEKESKVGKIAAGVAVGAVIAVGAACVAMNLKKRCIPIIKRMSRNTKKGKSTVFETKKPSSAEKNIETSRSTSSETQKPSLAESSTYRGSSTGFEAEKPSSAESNPFRRHTYNRSRSTSSLASEEPSKSPDYNTHSDAFASYFILDSLLDNKRANSAIDNASDVLGLSNTRGYSASDPLFGYDTTLNPSSLGPHDFGTPDVGTTDVDVGFDLPFF